MRTWKLNYQERDNQFVTGIAKSVTNHAITKLKAERFSEVKNRIRCIKDGVTGLNEYTLEERAELKELRAERDRLGRELGLA